MIVPGGTAFKMLAAAALLGGFLLPAQAQHNHSAGHSEYKDWSSRKVANCCDDRDCGQLRESEIRETKDGPQVLISGQWCPVLREHYLTRGKSPDWSAPHACIQPINPYNTAEPCERLLCFTGRGGF